MHVTKGALIFGILDVIGSLLLFALSMVGVVHWSSIDRNVYYVYANDYIVIAIGWGLSVIFAALLLYGLRSKRSCFVLAYIIWHAMRMASILISTGWLIYIIIFILWVPFLIKLGIYVVLLGLMIWSMVIVIKAFGYLKEVEIRTEMHEMGTVSYVNKGVSH